MPNGTVVVSLPFPDSGYATSSSSDAQQNQKWQFQNSFPEAQVILHAQFSAPIWLIYTIILNLVVGNGLRLLCGSIHH